MSSRGASIFSRSVVHVPAPEAPPVEEKEPEDRTYLVAYKDRGFEPLLALPIEIVLECLSLLAAPELMKLTLVSKQWYELATDDRLWKPLCAQKLGVPTFQLLPLEHTVFPEAPLEERIVAPKAEQATVLSGPSVASPSSSGVSDAFAISPAASASTALLPAIPMATSPGAMQMVLEETDEANELMNIASLPDVVTSRQIDPYMDPMAYMKSWRGVYRDLDVWIAEFEYAGRISYDGECSFLMNARIGTDLALRTRVPFAGPGCRRRAFATAVEIDALSGSKQLVEQWQADGEDESPWVELEELKEVGGRAMKCEEHKDSEDSDEAPKREMGSSGRRSLVDSVKLTESWGLPVSNLPHYYRVDYVPFSYYEVLLSERPDADLSLLRDTRLAPCVSIGVATNAFPLMRYQVGWRSKSFGFHSDDGNFFKESRNTSFSDPFGHGDIIGCGVDHRSGLLFYTVNGALMPTTARLDLDEDQYCPTIGIDDPTTRVTVNMGQYPFCFDISNAELSGMLKNAATVGSKAHLRQEEEEEYSDDEEEMEYSEEEGGPGEWYPILMDFARQHGIELFPGEEDDEEPGSSGDEDLDVYSDPGGFIPFEDEDAEPDGPASL